MKILNAIPEVPRMTMEEAEQFLESKLNLQFATIDSKGNLTFTRYGSTMTKIEKNYSS